MFEFETSSIAFWLLAVLGIIYGIWKHYFQKCKKCGGKFKMDSIKDSMGQNVSKKVTISFWRGPRKYTEIWKCESCGYEETKKYWEWDD